MCIRDRDAAARALNAEERAEEAVHALREEASNRLRTERALSDADLRAETAEARATHLAQQLHEAEIVRLKAERALRDAEKLGERLIGERQAISLDRDAAVAARDALACELKKAREDCRKARAELVSVQKAKAAADAAVSAGFGSAGERCMAISALVCVDPGADRLVPLIAERTAGLELGLEQQEERERKEAEEVAAEDHRDQTDHEVIGKRSLLSTV